MRQALFKSIGAKELAVISSYQTLSADKNLNSYKATMSHELIAPKAKNPDTWLLTCSQLDSHATQARQHPRV